jgi:hypothetical protein
LAFRGDLGDFDLGDLEAIESSAGASEDFVSTVSFGGLGFAVSLTVLRFKGFSVGSGDVLSAASGRERWTKDRRALYLALSITAKRFDLDVTLLLNETREVARKKGISVVMVCITCTRQ